MNITRRSKLCFILRYDLLFYLEVLTFSIVDRRMTGPNVLIEVSCTIEDWGPVMSSAFRFKSRRE